MSVLIDSSAWIESFRRTGNPQVTEIVAALVSRGEAATAGIVKLELLKGVHEREFERLKRHLSVLTLLHTSEAHYEDAGRLGGNLRRHGETIPTSDLLIATLAISHGVALLHCDRHFDRIADLTDLRVYAY